MRCPILVTALMMMATSPAVAADAFERELAAFIDSYQLPWMPDDRPLNGVRIVLDASGGGRATAEQRAADDLGLLVIEHLYHLADAARGRVALTRKGDHPHSIPGLKDSEVRTAYAERQHPQLVISVVGACGLERTQVDNGVDLVSSAMAKQLKTLLKAESLEGPVAVDAARVEGTCAHLVTVYIQRPCGDQSWVQTPEVFREPAKAIYDALVKVADEHDLVEAAQELPKIEREARSRRYSVWPAEAGDLPPERVDWFVKQFASRAISTRSLTLFDVDSEVVDGKVVLKGFTNFARMLPAVERALASVGMHSVENQIRVLPDEQVLGDKLYGVCVAPQVLSYANQGTRSSLQSQLLYGEPVTLLDKQGDEYLVHGGDGYWGWVIASAIRPMNAEEYADYLKRPQVSITQDSVLEGERVPAGSRLGLVSAAGGKGGHAATVMLANGKAASVSSDLIVTLDESGSAQDRVRRALRMLHTPYVFGGRSPLGTDCSGLVMNVCSQMGDVPARDAWQQAMAGRLVATAWNRENIQPGDILFYINRNGRIYHTGVALSKTHVIHSSDPCVRINSSQRGDRLFEERLERDFFMAKRP